MMDFDGETRNRFAPFPAHSPSIPSLRIMDEYTCKAVGLLVLPVIPPLIVPTMPADDDDATTSVAAATTTPCSPVCESMRIRSSGFVAVLAIMPARPPHIIRRVMSAAPRAAAFSSLVGVDDVVSSTVS